MIYNLFYFKCAINLNGNKRITCGKAKMCLFNITFLRKLLYRFTTSSTKSLFLRKNLTRKKIKTSTSPQISPKCRKNSLHWRKSISTFNIRQNLVFQEYPKSEKVIWPKHVCLRRNHGLIFEKRWNEVILNIMTYCIGWLYIEFPEKAVR